MALTCVTVVVIVTVTYTNEPLGVWVWDGEGEGVREGVNEVDGKPEGEPDCVTVTVRVCCRSAEGRSAAEGASNPPRGTRRTVIVCVTVM